MQPLHGLFHFLNFFVVKKKKKICNKKEVDFLISELRRFPNKEHVLLSVKFTICPIIIIYVHIPPSNTSLLILEKQKNKKQERPIRT